MTAGQFIGIDLGGTKVAAATLRDGRLRDCAMEPTRSGGADALVGQLSAAIDRLRTRATRAVGIGIPSTIDLASGRVRHSVNLPLEDTPLAPILSERTRLPVCVENDASCAALAEAFEDGRLVCPDLVMFTVGTGVGGGLVLGGRLYRGATGAAAELGHTLIAHDPAAGGAATPGRFPHPGSLERLASGRAFDDLVVEAARDQPGSALGHRLAAGDAITGRDAVELARTGDPLARELLRVLGERLGVGIANAINTFDPSEVVIGGGVSRAGELLRAPAERSARRHIVPGTGTATRIRLARHGWRAGMLGAALVAAQRQQPESAR